MSADHADAATVSLPVYTPATSEAFATYGTVDEGAVLQTLLPPTGVFPQFGGLEVTTSSTAVQALTDAVFYLAEYPYRSADAYASRIIAITALRPVLEAFAVEDRPTPAEFEETITSDLKELAALQNFDGGFGWWFRDQRSRPFQSIQAMHALVVATKDGYSVSPEVMENGRWYLRDIRQHIPSDWDQETKDMLEAYALHVRHLDGDSDTRGGPGPVGPAGVPTSGSTRWRGSGRSWPTRASRPRSNAPSPTGPPRPPRRRRSPPTTARTPT